ncbi:hypothetical protein KJ611_02120 [Patescibacteria group bacterium]|nr:hypothetical protein [Patescibacteria group bacterium]
MKKLLGMIGGVFYVPFALIFGVAALLYGLALLFPVERPVPRLPRFIQKHINIRFHP